MRAQDRTRAEQRVRFSCFLPYAPLSQPDHNAIRRLRPERIPSGSFIRPVHVAQRLEWQCCSDRDRLKVRFSFLPSLFALVLTSTSLQHPPTNSPVDSVPLCRRHTAYVQSRRPSLS
jgi:hypothetical protein